MDELSMKFNKMIMEEIGLESRDGRLYDQDSGTLMQFEGKDLIAPGSNPIKGTQEFDPYNNTRMMAQIFTWFTDALAQSGEADEYDVIYNVDTGKGQGHIEMKNDTDKIVSGTYLRDQCKYADLILQLNGDDNPDLKEFDIPKERPGVKPTRKRSSNTKKKVK